MSGPFDSRDPLAFGRAPARGRDAVEEGPVLPPGGTRRAVAELLDDDVDRDDELLDVDERRTPAVSVADLVVDRALFALFVADRKVRSSPASDGDGWSGAHRAAVEAWWDDGLDGRAPAHSRRIGPDRGVRRRARTRRSPTRRPLVAVGAAVATLAATIAAPLLLRAVGGGGELGVGQRHLMTTGEPVTSIGTGARPVAVVGVPQPVTPATVPTTFVDGTDLVTASSTPSTTQQQDAEATPAQGTDATPSATHLTPTTARPSEFDGPLVTPTSTTPRRRLGVFFVVFDRLCQGAVLDLDEVSDAAERTLSALTSKLVPPCGSQVLDAADARIVPSDLEGATVALGERYRMMGTQQQVLVAGQIVLSLDANGVSPVRFVDPLGEPMAVPTGRETYTAEPVTARDYGYLVTSDPDYRPARSSRA